jgi:hypothetical protein
MLNGVHSQNVQTMITCSSTQRQEIFFALFIGVVGSCSMGEKKNYNQMSFANTVTKNTGNIFCSVHIPIVGHTWTEVCF